MNSGLVLGSSVGQPLLPHSLQLEMGHFDLSLHLLNLDKKQNNTIRLFKTPTLALLSKID